MNELSLSNHVFIGFDDRYDFCSRVVKVKHIRGDLADALLVASGQYFSYVVGVKHLQGDLAGTSSLEGNSFLV